ncbi:MAG TPA: thiamine phosphate synthase, partial [Acidobacteriaceae bacterium]|nr:thiamine phosphate synthase [Acidobacteriaceae bacterium]
MLHYAITDRVRSASETWSQEQALLRQAGRLAQTGIDYVQLREKDLDAGALASLARRLVAILRVAANPPKLLLNSRADAAVAAGADGVHLSASVGSLTPADVRKLYAATGLPEPIVSISCHTLKEVQAARAAGATLILFGPIFEKVV